MAEAFWFPDYKADQSEAPYEHEPLALARETKDYCSTGWWAYVCSCGCDRTRSGRDKAKPPRLIKGSSEKATSTGVSSSNASSYGFQMEKMAAMFGKRASTRPPLIRLEVYRRAGRGGGSSGRTLMSGRLQTTPELVVKRQRHRVSRIQTRHAEYL